MIGSAWPDAVLTEAGPLTADPGLGYLCATSDNGFARPLGSACGVVLAAVRWLHEHNGTEDTIL